MSTVLYSLVSSANSFIWESATDGKSFMNMMNNIGPSTLPCGTYRLTQEYILILSHLSLLFEIYLWGSLLSRQVRDHQFHMIGLCIWDVGEVHYQKLFDSPGRYSPHYDHCRLYLSIPHKLPKAAEQDLPPMKPCCSSHISLFCSTWCMTCFLTIFSMTLLLDGISSNLVQGCTTRSRWTN